MRTEPMKDSDGKFGDWTMKGNIKCPDCGRWTIGHRLWESSCGGYDDYQYKCFGEGCTHVHWVDGSDA